MPKYRVREIAVYEVEADDREHAKQLVADAICLSGGAVKLFEVEDREAWVAAR